MASYYAGRRAQCMEAVVMRELIRYARERDEALAERVRQNALLMARLEAAKGAVHDRTPD